MVFPKTVEELFKHFVSATRFRIYEVGSTKECKELYEWATVFAQQHEYPIPTKEDCGIYYEDDEYSPLTGLHGFFKSHTIGV